MDVVKLVKTKLLVQANSGAGKSWCLRRLLEQTHGRLQHLVIDPEGEFASLREKYDYVLAAKKGGDTVADPRSAKLLAERLLELGVSAILDIYELKAHDRIQFVKNFVEALVDAPKKFWHPVLVVLDEAHVYCPEQGKAESAGAVIDLATRGRKRGFCAVLATQRLAKLHKDAAAEANNKLIGRTGLDVDLKRAADDLGFGKDRWPDLRKLREGQFFAFGPAISTEVLCVQVGSVRTKHPSAGARLGLRVPPPTARVRALLPKLADLPAEAEERLRTNAELQKRVRQLERELRMKPATETKTERVEVPVLSKKEFTRLDASVSALGKCSSWLQDESGALSRTLATVAAAIDRVSRNSHGSTAREKPRAAPPMTKKPSLTANVSHANDGNTDLKPRHQDILRALAEFEQMGMPVVSNQRIATAIGLALTGSFNNYLSALSTRGFIERTGGEAQLTDVGREAAGDVQLRTHEEIMELWLPKLSPRHREILVLLVRVYPKQITNDDLAESIGLKNTGSFNNYLSKLSTLGLIVRSHGSARASEHLYP